MAPSTALCPPGTGGGAGIAHGGKAQGCALTASRWPSGVLSCEACCIPAHMQGLGHQGEEDCDKECPRWVVTRDSAWRGEQDGGNSAVLQRTLLSILHSSSRNNHLF